MCLGSEGCRYLASPVVGPQAFGLPIRQETYLIVCGFAAANPSTGRRASPANRIITIHMVAAGGTIDDGN